jgi:glycosyltransferase involved in cell wall biosynthesis
MTKKPLISVIITAYNEEKYISDAIESILNQTFEDFSVTVMDDCSTDSTWDIVQRYCEKDSRIKAFRNEENLYIAANRNRGIQRTTGKYVVWQDGDDISLPHRLETLVNFMEKNPEVGICGSYIESFNENGVLDTRKYFAKDEDLRNNIFRFSPVAQPAAILRRKCFEEFGYFDLAYPPAEDLEMSFRIGEKYKFANIPEVLLKYREHGASATHTKKTRQLRATLKIRSKYATGHGYKMNYGDRMAYFFTWVTLFLPASITVKLFKISKGIAMSKIGRVFNF